MHSDGFVVTYVLCTKSAYNAHMPQTHHQLFRSIWDFSVISAIILQLKYAAHHFIDISSCNFLHRVFLSTNWWLSMGNFSFASIICKYEILSIRYLYLALKLHFIYTFNSRGERIVLYILQGFSHSVWFILMSEWKWKNVLASDSF